MLSTDRAVRKGQPLPSRAPAWQQQQDMASAGAPTRLPWEGSWRQTRPTFVLSSSVVGAFTHISFPIVHGEPVLQGLFGQQRASLVQFIEYLREQKSNTITGLRTPCFPSKACAGKLGQVQSGLATLAWHSPWHKLW